MVNFANGKIYAVCVDGEVYVGSTTKTRLCSRRYEHVSRSRDPRYANNSLYAKINSIETKWLGIHLELLEEYSCETKDQLHSKEAEWVRKIDTLNHIIPCRTHKECREEKKAEIAEKRKHHYEQHKSEYADGQRIYNEHNQAKVAERRKQYYENHKSDVSEKQRIYTEKHKDRIAEWKKVYYVENKETIAKKGKDYWEKHREDTCKKKRQYYQANCQVINEK
jgi:hypothetical protein